MNRLSNGNLTLFDNRRHRLPEYSRVVEYNIDETNYTAQLVWSYRATPDIYAEAMAGAQRLPNENTVIGWGTGFPAMSEVKPDGTKAFELTFTENMSYRVYRFPWKSQPITSPTLVAKTETPTITFYYSWNGATNIRAYQLYGGSTTNPTTLIDTPLKTDFETTTVITNPAPELCYFRVMPVDELGEETQYSNIVSICGQIYLPMLLK